jgi:hypothetical protein
MRSPVIAAMLLACGLAVPPSQASAQVEPEEQGTQTLGGVHVTAVADNWAGWPTELTEVIPLLVTIENNGTVPLRLRYREFRLSAPDDIRPAMPPLEINERETVAVGTFGPGVGYGFYGAMYGGYYGAPFRGAYYPDPWFYSSYYPLYYDVQLPTQDMVTKALPERVLEPADVVRGFLYFEDGDPAGDAATLEVDLIDATSGAKLDTIRIPLEID